MTGTGGTVTHPTPALVIHIGPPKTATTSLQAALDGALPGDVDFLGAYQPRGRNGATGCHVVNDWCKDPGLGASARVRDFLARVDANTRDGITSIVVEEGLLDSSQQVGWDSKIAHLGQLLAPRGAVPALTLRDPRDGVLSLHREFSDHLGVLARHNVLAFIRTHQCRVFDYRHLLATLGQAGFASVRLLAFDSLVRDGIALGRLTGRNGDHPVLRLEKMNAAGTARPRGGLADRAVRVMIRKWIADYTILKAQVAAQADRSLFAIDDLLAALAQPGRGAG